jgi:hypothetical protein
VRGCHCQASAGPQPGRPAARRFVFHLSGRQRVQCCSEGGWGGAPGCQLVLIGQDLQLLQHLAAAFKELHQCQGQAEPGAGGGAAAAGIGVQPPQAGLEQLVRQHGRLEVLAAGGSSGAASSTAAESAGAAGAGGLAAAGGASAGSTSAGSNADAAVEFSVLGSPLHGVIAEEVNAQVRRRRPATIQPNCLWTGFGASTFCVGCAPSPA